MIVNAFLGMKVELKCEKIPVESHDVDRSTCQRVRLKTEGDNR